MSMRQHEPNNSWVNYVIYLLPLMLLFGCEQNDSKSGKLILSSDPEVVSLSDNVKTLNILAFGDSGTGLPEQKAVSEGMVKACQSHGCDFGMLLGDNIYEKGVVDEQDLQFKTKFDDIYGKLGIPFYVVLGNHDYKGGGASVKAEIEYSNHSEYWRMPSRYYKVESELVEIFALDTEVFVNDLEQQKWLENSFENKSAIWTFVMGHHPIISYGHHGTNKSLVEALLPSLCQFGDLYLSGHDHDLQLNEADCGLPLVVSGSAGKLRDTGTGPASHFAISELGFSIVSLDETEAIVRYFDQKGALLYQSFIDNR